MGFEPMAPRMVHTDGSTEQFPHTSSPPSSKVLLVYLGTYVFGCFVDSLKPHHDLLKVNLNHLQTLSLPGLFFFVCTKLLPVWNIFLLRFDAQFDFIISRRERSYEINWKILYFHQENVRYSMPHSPPTKKTTNLHSFIR